MNTYLNNLFNLENKSVVITGSGGHLCSEMARTFAYANCQSITLIDLRLHKAEAVKKELNDFGYTNVIALEADVAKRNDMIACLESVLSKFNKVDVLVNGAGTNCSTPFFELTEEEWDSVMNSQLKGTFFGCQIFGAHMVSRGKGSIINVSSASADPPLSKAFPYSAAKAGIKNLTKNLAREWANKGVRVNAIRPGFFPTDWNLKNFITPEREAAILNHTPMGRFGKPSELNGAILWLASDAATFVTGSEVFVDGGFACMTI